MSDQFERDLADLEAGRLSIDDVQARHPGIDLRAAAAIGERLSVLASEQAPDPEPGWAALRERLPERAPSFLARVRLRARRPLVAAIAVAMLAVGAIAYAAGPSAVRRSVDTVVGGITGIFRGEEPPPVVIPTRTRPDDRPGVAGSGETPEGTESREEDDRGDQEGPGPEGSRSPEPEESRSPEPEQTEPEPEQTEPDHTASPNPEASPGGGDDSGTGSNSGSSSNDAGD